MKNILISQKKGLKIIKWGLTNPYFYVIMYSVEDGNDNRIFASKSFILSFLFFNINKNAKELFKFNKNDTELIGLIKKRD